MRQDLNVITGFQLFFWNVKPWSRYAVADASLILAGGAKKLLAL
jgi:hypothetical protein